MCDKGIPIILVSLAILFVPVKSGAEIPAAESSEIVHQLELIRLEIAQQGRRIATLEHASAVAGQTPNYHVVAPTQPAGHTPNPILQPSSPQAKTYTVRLGDSLSHHRQTPRRLDRFDRRGQPARLRRQNQNRPTPHDPNQTGSPTHTPGKANSDHQLSPTHLSPDPRTPNRGNPLQRRPALQCQSRGYPVPQRHR